MIRVSEGGSTRETCSRFKVTYQFSLDWHFEMNFEPFWLFSCKGTEREEMNKVMFDQTPSTSMGDAGASENNNAHMSIRLCLQNGST